MHIFFSGIGGSGIGSLSLIALQIGYEVSGSDDSNTNSIDYLRSKGITNISTTQTYEAISSIHDTKNIDWLVYSSAIIIQNPNSEELQFCKDKNIKTTKRDELINFILKEKELKLASIAGTHGKSTTTAMTIWLFKSLSIPISYLFSWRKHLFW
jgi:UDP-N-acetylmuramate--alanine ligase